MSAKATLFLGLLLSIVAQARTYELTDNGPEVKIPSEIWNEFGDAQGNETVTFAPLIVRLVEKTPGVLMEPSVEIKLPRGGGQIDLSHYVRNQQGTFRVYFDLPEMQDDKKLKAFFISRAKKRKLGNEIWGAGCNKYMKIDSFVVGEARKKGLEVNTTRHRHLSVLGGTFFFGMNQHVSQVTFVDSQAPQFFCETNESK